MNGAGKLQLGKESCMQPRSAEQRVGVPVAGRQLKLREGGEAKEQS